MTPVTKPHNYVFAYSEYRTIKAMEYIEDGMGGESNSQAYEWNSKNYSGATGRCPFCMVSMTVVLKNPRQFEHQAMYGDNTVWECQECGWWELERKFEAGGVEHEVAYAAIHHQACVKRFNLGSAAAPTDALVDHLRKKPESIYGLDKKKMEEIVQYVYSSFYNCEVHHCGKSHDGGVDLIMIDAENPTMIQVKCRESATAVEPVSQIREFLGAMWSKKATKGIFVSTADHYSPRSIKTIHNMLSDGSLTSFDMVDCRQFVGLLKAVTSPRQSIWEKLLDEHYIDGETG